MRGGRLFPLQGAMMGGGGGGGGGGVLQLQGATVKRGEGGSSSNYGEVLEVQGAMVGGARSYTERFTHFIAPVTGVSSRLNSATGTPLAANMGA